MVDLSPHRRSKRPSSFLAGPYGHPFHATLVAIPIGTWSASIIFDLVSFFGDDPAVFERGSQWLVGIGVLGGLAAAAIGLMDLSTLASGTRARKIALTHMTLNFSAIAIFAISFFLRLGTEDQVSVFAVILSLIGIGLVGASGYLGGELAYRYGVRVADEETQEEGFRQTGG